MARRGGQGMKPLAARACARPLTAPSTMALLEQPNHARCAIQLPDPPFSTERARSRSSAGYRPATLPLDSLVGSLAACPIASLGPAEDLQRPWPASVPVRGRLFLVTGKSGRGDFRGLEDLGRVTRDREFEAGFLRLASLLETKLHSSSSIGQVARQWEKIKPRSP
jgi:hypothetical protein